MSKCEITLPNSGKLLLMSSSKLVRQSIASYDLDHGGKEALRLDLEAGDIGADQALANAVAK